MAVEYENQEQFDSEVSELLDKKKLERELLKQKQEHERSIALLKEDRADARARLDSDTKRYVADQGVKSSMLHLLGTIGAAIASGIFGLIILDVKDKKSKREYDRIMRDQNEGFYTKDAEKHSRR